MRKPFFTLLLCLCFYSIYSQGLYLPEFHYTPVSPTQPITRSTYSLPNSYSNPLLSAPIPLPEVNYNRVETILKDGWYEANVTYSNPNTGTKSNYLLNVKIFDDRIIVISFGNEGSIHTGSNDSGYTYSGGDLTFYQNKQGEIVSADTTVKIFRSGSYSYFEIEL